MLFRSSSDESDDNPADNTDTAITTVTNSGGGGTTNGVDLTGEWGQVTTKCKGKSLPQKCTVKGRLTIMNLGETPAPSSFVRFYLSDDGVFDGSDMPLKQEATGKIKFGKDKHKTLSAKLPAGVDPTGKFIIAVIDVNNTVAEDDETNNIVVFGPL